MAGYLILSTPRSGSNLLSDTLRQAGLGNPIEWLGTSSLSAWMADRGSDEPVPRDRRELTSYLRSVREGQPGEAAGIKLHWHHFTRLPLEDPHDLLLCLTEAGLSIAGVVLLEREDILGQAISTLIAAQTGEYLLFADGSRSNPEFYTKPYWSTSHTYRAPAPPSFNRAEMDLILEELKHANAAWRQWIRESRLPSLRLTYEGLSVDREGAAAAVAGLLGVEPMPLSAPSIMPQRSEINDVFRRRYLSSH